jgi:hypothetical protein
LLIKATPDLSAVDYARVWGTEAYEYASSVVIPPELPAEDAVVVNQLFADDRLLRENARTRVSLVPDSGGAEHFALSVPGYRNASLTCAVAGPGASLFLGGSLLAEDLDSQLEAWVVKFNWAGAAAEDMPEWSFAWVAPIGEFADVFCMDFLEDRLLLGGSTGMDSTPGGYEFPTIFTASADGFDPWAAIWGDGHNLGRTVFGLRAQPEYGVAVGFDVDNPDGRWRWRLSGTDLRPAQNTAVTPTDRPLEGYDYFDNSVQVEDITEELLGQQDFADHYGDVFAARLLSLDQATP